MQAERLTDLIEGITSLAIIGMAKNVGKTTVLNYLTSGLTCRHRSIGVASVGREGVRQDVLTGAVKPLINLPKSALLATGRKLIPLCRAGLEILEVLPFHCPFGELVIAKVRTPGPVELAGPVRIDELKAVLNVFKEKGAAITMVDGALDRKAAGMPGVAEALLLATGPPVGASMEEVINRTVHQVNLLALPGLSGGKAQTAAEDILINGSVGIIYDQNSTLDYQILKYKSLLGWEKAIAQELQTGTVLVLGGTLEDTALRELMLNAAGCREVTLVVRDPFRLFLEPGTVAGLADLGWKIKVLRKPRLLAVTASSRSERGRAFAPKKFLRALGNALDPVPVFDVGILG